MRVKKRQYLYNGNKYRLVHYGTFFPLSQKVIKSFLDMHRVIELGCFRVNLAGSSLWIGEQLLATSVIVLSHFLLPFPLSIVDFGLILDYTKSFVR